MLAGVGLVGRLGGQQSARRFTPTRLFAAGEVGAWYDPSDLTTLFKDTAGLTPVTAAADTVALMLDKSKQTSFEARRNIVTYSADLSQSVWSKTGLTVNSTTAPAPSGPDTANRVTFNGTAGCRVERNISGQLTTAASYTWSGYFRMTSGSGTFRLGVLRNGWGDNVFQSVTLDTNWQRISVTFTAANTSCYVIIGNDQTSTFGGQVDIWGLQLEAGIAATTYQETGASFPSSWLGNHATQATAASRPTYAVVPLGGRRNLLTYTQSIHSFTSVWQSWLSATTASTATTDPDGGTTASKITFGTSATSEIYQNFTVPNGTTTISAWVRSDTGKKFRFKFGNSGGGANLFSSDVTPTSSWQRFSFTATASSALNVSIANEAGGAVGTVEVWGLQFETGSTATAYQRVVSQYDVTEAGVQSLSYLSFDGVDDGMATASITTGVNKAQVFAGIRKASDAARGAIAEHTASAASNNGAWLLAAPNAASDTFAFESKGTSLTDAVATGIAAPATRVLAGLGDIAGDSTILRVNGVQADADTGDQGTGNYANAVLYIGRRGGSSLPFSGSLFGLIARYSSANLDAGTVSQTETWIAAKTGVTL